MDERLDKIQKSINDLTAAVAQGFSNVEERFSNVEERMATKVEVAALEKKVDAGFEGVNGKIDGLHRRIDAELERTLLIEGRLVKVEEFAGITK